MGSRKRKAWEKRPTETDNAYAALKVYIDLGASRSLAKAGQLLGKGAAVLERWSVQHDWRARVDAWEDEQNAAWAKDRKARVREVADRHAALARSFCELIESKLSTINPDDLTPADLARWLDAAVKVERMSLGMSTAVLAGGGANGEIEHRHVLAIQEAERAFSRRLGIDLAGSEAPSVADGVDE
jgi:hypothetical protein